MDLYVSASWDTRPIVAPSCPSNCFSISCCIYVVISFSLASSSAGTSEDLLVPHETIRSLCGGRDTAPGSTNPCYLVVGVVGSASFIRSTEQTQGRSLPEEKGHFLTKPPGLSHETQASPTNALSGYHRVLPAADESTYTITASFQSTIVQLVTGQPARATSRYLITDHLHSFVILPTSSFFQRDPLIPLIPVSTTMFFLLRCDK